jgi:hypothetical protein
LRADLGRVSLASPERRHIVCSAYLLLESRIVEPVRWKRGRGALALGEEIPERIFRVGPGEFEGEANNGNVL